MNVIQLWPGSPLGNFNYLIIFGNVCYVVDPFDKDLINQHIETNKLSLVGIINTHFHWDHVKANEELKEQHKCEVICHERSVEVIPGASHGVRTGDIINLGDDKITFTETPGHTEDHVCLFLSSHDRVKAVISGDTLFNAGVGNCRNGGDVNDLYTTISEHFFTLEDDVIVYPGHDYILNNLRFTLSVEPDNSYAQNLLSKLEGRDEQCFCSYLTTIGEEKKMNSFFRLHSKSIRQKLNIDAAGDKEVFVKLRSMRDNW